MTLLEGKTRVWLTATTILAAAGTIAGAQAPATDDTVKILRCSEDRIALIWLSREQLRDKCGMWSRSYTVKTADGEIERIIYSRYFVVTVQKGKVSSVRQRRQIFTGFKKER
jgi:hypothetical protein